MGGIKLNPQVNYVLVPPLSCWKERGNEGKQVVRSPGRVEMSAGRPCAPRGHRARVPALHLPWTLWDCSSSRTVRL